MLLFLMLMTGFAGFVDSAAGGGGLISLPAYLFAGLPVHYTYGTNKFSAACGTTFATAQFFQKGAMNIRVGLLAAVGSFVGSALGSHIVLLLSDQVLRSVSVYSFSSGSAEQLMMVGYSKFITCDLNDDGCSELMVILPGESETGTGSAVLYRMQDGNIERSVEVNVSEDATHIRRITVGRLLGGTPAVFVASAVNNSAIVTDVFAWRNDRFSNISYSRESDTSVQTLRNYYVYAEDIDGDGVMELPSLITMKRVFPEQEGKQKFLIRWFAMDLEGREMDKFFPFHNYLGGWYMQLASSWAPRVSVEQEGGKYTFYVWDEDYRQALDVFSIYALTGGSREEDATVDGRFAFYRAEGVVYAAKLEANAAEFGITENQLINNFHLIQQDWKTGET